MSEKISKQFIWEATIGAIPKATIKQFAERILMRMSEVIPKWISARFPEGAFF